MIWAPSQEDAGALGRRSRCGCDVMHSRAFRLVTLKRSAFTANLAFTIHAWLCPWYQLGLDAPSSVFPSTIRHMRHSNNGYGHRTHHIIQFKETVVSSDRLPGPSTPLSIQPLQLCGLCLGSSVTETSKLFCISGTGNKGGLVKCCYRGVTAFHGKLALPVESKLDSLKLK